jgi:hypothetical protein
MRNEVTFFIIHKKGQLVARAKRWENGCVVIFKAGRARAGGTDAIEALFGECGKV